MALSKSPFAKCLHGPVAVSFRIVGRQADDLVASAIALSKLACA